MQSCQPKTGQLHQTHEMPCTFACHSCLVVRVLVWCDMDSRCSNTFCTPKHTWRDCRLGHTGQRAGSSRKRRRRKKRKRRKRRRKKILYLYHPPPLPFPPHSPPPSLSLSSVVSILSTPCLFFSPPSSSVSPLSVWSPRREPSSSDPRERGKHSWPDAWRRGDCGSVGREEERRERIKDDPFFPPLPPLSFFLLICLSWCTRVWGKVRRNYLSYSNRRNN